jgi:bifunctional UDP-N-acetylglucosamine pyrophosphorylase/glucosamine-1-phosphate N-acetyltransferase
MPASVAPSSSSTAAFPDCAAVILAAGKSTRMRSRLPKPLHPLCGLPLTAHVIRSCQLAGIARSIVVIGHEGDTVRAGLGDGVEYAVQHEQRGSGDAAKAAESALAGFTGTVVVLAGDVPLLGAQTVRQLVEHHRATGATATLLTAAMDDPTGYGRIVRNADGTVSRIVEHRDATPEERAIREINPSIYCFESGPLFEALRQVQPNNIQGEFYLTDVIELMSGSGGRVEAVAVADARETLGVNTRVELALVGSILRLRILEDLMLSGVTVVDPASTWVDINVSVGQDAVLQPHTFLLGSTSIGDESVIGPYSRIVDTTVGRGCAILASNIVECEIADRVKIGPYANLRPGCRLAEGVKVGDFVELKNASLGRKVSASHLSYIGDAEVGEGTNIGAGTVTCNYDGVRKYRTVIGKNAFIGTHSTLIAPITVGDGAFIAAGSPIDQDVPADALALARSRTTIKPQWAQKRRESHAKSL